MGRVEFHPEVPIAIHGHHEVEVLDVDGHELCIRRGDDTVGQRCGARLSASKSNAVNLILRLFLYRFLHTMSS